MTLKFHNVTRIAGIVLAGFALLAAGELPQGEVIKTAPATIEIAATPIVDAASAAPIVADTAALDQSDETAAADIAVAKPANLRTLVSQIVDLPTAPLDAEARCLARAVYFEARGEPLEGQLAVAQVIMNRVASGRYADNVCGVVDQPGQFTFARRTVSTSSNDYRVAQAIAVIAQAESWLQVAPRTMSFHAKRVNVSWGNMRPVSSIGNHVFYR